MEWKRRLRIFEEKSLPAFETKCGMRAMTFSPGDQQAIKKANKAVQEKMAGKAFPEGLMNDIQEALKIYRVRH